MPPPATTTFLGRRRVAGTWCGSAANMEGATRAEAPVRPATADRHFNASRRDMVEGFMGRKGYQFGVGRHGTKWTFVSDPVRLRKLICIKSNFALASDTVAMQYRTALSLLLLMCCVGLPPGATA